MLCSGLGWNNRVCVMQPATEKSYNAPRLGRVHTDNFTRRAYRSRRVARVHTASTASGSSGTLRPHQEVFAVDANGSRRLGSAV